MDGRLSRWRVRLTDRAVWRPEGDGFLLFDVRSETLSRGNAEGCLVLRGLDDGLSAQEIATELSQARRVPPATALRDVERFLAALVAAGLAEGSYAPA